MSQTGATLALLFDLKTNSSYTNYLDDTKMNRIFRNAVLSTLEKIYNEGYDEQKNWDQITFITSVANTFTPSSNTLSTANLQINSVTNFSSTVFLISTVLPHYLTSGQSATISGVQGTLTMSSANGTFVVTVVSANTFKITVSSATGVYTALTGEVVTPSTISDYWHLLAIKPIFNTPIYGLSITNASNTTPILITINQRSIIRTGSQIVISGVTGNTNANGTFYAKSLNDFTIGLYSDVNFQTPIAGNGAYVSGGVISYANSTYADPITSTMKQGVLNQPTPRNPYYEIANDLIKIHPLTSVCSSVKMDYIREPSIVIDVTDAVTDLTLYYPEKFLYTMIDEAATLYAAMSRDPELYQTETLEERKNP